MRRGFAIVVACVAIACSLALAGCGGSGETSSQAAARAEVEAAAQAQAQAEAEAQAKAAEAQAVLEEGIGIWYGTAEGGFDREKARAAFQRAADGGNAEGYYWLGAVRETDVDAGRQAEVLSLYQKAADAGSAKGYVGQAWLYCYGWGVDQDYAKAQQLFQQAIDDGELRGYGGLGYLYRKGWGVEASGTKAAECYEKELASDEWATRNAARCSLGGLYSVGAEGVEADGAKATSYYQAAADEDYRSGWGGLGNMYSAEGQVHDQGAGVDPDMAKKFECLTRQAELGSMTNLGVCYEYGWGCEQSYERAIELYTQEASSGASPADGMVCMATMAVNGWGVEKDYAVANDWLDRALDAAGPGNAYVVDRVNNLRDWMANN